MLVIKLLVKEIKHLNMQTNPSRFVVVDDDEDELHILTSYFNSDGTRFFRGVLPCMQYLKSLPGADLPKVILTDLQMPGHTGFDLIELVKTNEQLKDITVYVYSSCSVSQYKEKCRQLGAADFFAKPTTTADYNLFAERMLQTLQGAEAKHF